jgi:hypothetical protein
MSRPDFRISSLWGGAERHMLWQEVEALRQRAVRPQEKKPANRP